MIMQKKPIKEEPKKLFQYSVEMEVMVPATMYYRVQAENPQQALEIAITQGPNKVNNAPKIFWGRLKRVSAKVLNAGTSILQLTKKF